MNESESRLSTTVSMHLAGTRRVARSNESLTDDRSWCWRLVAAALSNYPTHSGCSYTDDVTTGAR